jgi:hypothetical protein
LSDVQLFFVINRCLTEEQLRCCTSGKYKRRSFFYQPYAIKDKSP